MGDTAIVNLARTWVVFVVGVDLCKGLLDESKCLSQVDYKGISHVVLGYVRETNTDGVFVMSASPQQASQEL